MKLEDFFKQYSKVAIAFSGGVDSAFLLYQAMINKASTIAYYVKSDFQPEFELQDAIKLTNKLGVKLKIIDINVLQDENIKANTWDRCYFCKKKIFGTILSEAKKDGFEIVLDGTNASDEYEDRPGMKAKDELEVLSPLRECGLTKTDIRKLSKQAGLFTWDKPSYSCLATRIKKDTKITKEKLKVTENAEVFLMELGFKDFRIRYTEEGAKIQVIEEDFEKVFKYREIINEKLSKSYKTVLLDLELRNENGN